MSSIAPYCAGTWCPLKGACAHYYSPLSAPPTSNYFPGVPYNPVTKSCTEFIGFNEAKPLQDIKEVIKKRKNKK